MAHSTLPVFSHPFFPEVLDPALGQQIQSIQRVFVPLTINNNTLVALDLCAHESGESCWGAGDSVSCRQLATVFDLVTENEYCARCFAEVSRG